MIRRIVVLVALTFSVLVLCALFSLVMVIQAS